MTTALKPISQQKLLEVLENCKQIPKDDRLVLRKLLKDGDEQLTTILTDFNHKKLQIRVRKYFQKCKQNKQGQEINRQKTVVDVRGLTKQPAPSYYRSAMQSMQKQRQMRRTHHSKDYKDQLKQCKSLNSSKCDPVRSMKVNTCTQGSFAPIQFKIDTRNSATKYTYEDNYLKQSQSNIFSPPQFLKWDSLKLATSIPTSNITSGRNSVSLYPANPISNSKISEQSEFSSIFSRLRASLPGIPGLPLTGQKDPEKDVYNLKSILIKHYAEDIFDHLVQLHFPLSINEKSVYLPYRQLLQQLQTYLRNKGQTIDIIKENDQKIMLLQPFLNEYEGVSLKNLGIFLNKFCLHKNNNIRNIFIVLESGDKGNISVDKFRKINSWKGQDLVSAFQVVVKKWGQCNAIGYWQLYRVKKEKEFIYFINLYQKV